MITISDQKINNIKKRRKEREHTSSGKVAPLHMAMKGSFKTKYPAILNMYCLSSSSRLKCIIHRQTLLISSI